MRQKRINLYLLAPLIFAILSQQRSAAQATPKIPTVQDKYLELARKVYTWSEDEESKNRETLGETAEMQIVDQMHRLIQQQVIASIRRGVKQDEISNELKPFQKVSLAADAQVTNTPLARCFSLNSEPYCLAAYTILRGGEAIPDSQAYLDFFTCRAASSEVIGIPTSDFRGRRFFVREVPALVWGQEWVLAWGNALGDTGARLNARLYSFDGSHVVTLWHRDDLVGGVLEVSGDSVNLEYDPYYHAPFNERKSELLHFTPNGLQ